MAEALAATVSAARGGRIANVALLTMPAAGRDPLGDRAALVFSRNAGQYALKDVWGNASDGDEVIPGSARRHPHQPDRH